jgi:hypothetical protein
LECKIVWEFTRPITYEKTSVTPAKEVEMKSVSRGYADVNGIKLYHEIYGEGEPMVLIHGGLTTIGEVQGWAQPLAMSRQVIAVEMQGHGRTADTDRPMSFTTMSDDIAVLLDRNKNPVGADRGFCLIWPATLPKPRPQNVNGRF